jgi:hypothetical protein
MINDKIIMQSFNIPYALLMTTGTITFIEALTTSDPVIRHMGSVQLIISDTLQNIVYLTSICNCLPLLVSCQPIILISPLS